MLIDNEIASKSRLYQSFESVLVAIFLLMSPGILCIEGRLIPFGFSKTAVTSEVPLGA